MGVFWLILAISAIAWSSPAASQDNTAVPQSSPTTAPVILDGTVLFRIRGVSAYPAEQRAVDFSTRIAAAAADRSFPAESVVVREAPEASYVMGAGRPLVVVTEPDAEIEGVPRHVLAEAYRRRITSAIIQYRYDRTSPVLWRHFVHALGATLVLAVGLWLGRRIVRRLGHALSRRTMHDLHIRHFELVRAEQLRQGLARALRVGGLVLGALACYWYLQYVLKLFPWTRQLGNELAELLFDPLRTIGTGLVRYVPSLIFLIILVIITRYVLRITKLFFQGVERGSVTIPGFQADWAKPTDRIVRVWVVAFALVMAYPYIPGSGSEAFKGMTLLLGLIFSLGSPSVIGNLVAGQSLAFRRAFRIGDRIKIGEHVGIVTEIRLLTTYLRSPKNEQIAIPNSMVINTEVVNYSTYAQDTGLILHSIVGIGYDTPWRQVEAMLLEAARRTDGVLREPPPFVLQKTLGTFAVDYEINVYYDNPLGMIRLYTALHRNILDVFNEYGVQIMTPAYEGDPDRPKVVPRGRWSLAPAGDNTASGSNDVTNQGE